jgi:hypothetical protein
VTPIEIPLGRKYRSAHHGRHTSKHNDDTRYRNKRRKIGQQAHELRYGPPTLKYLEMGVTGKKRMRLAGMQYVDRRVSS